MVKVFWSELDVRLHELALDLLGPHAELLDGDDAAWMKGYEFALAGPIYAGTNEIQRNVIAERVLGLPRKYACSSRSPTTSSPCATRCATSSRRSAPPRTCAPRGRTRPAGCPACGNSSPTWACSACSHPKTDGGLGLTFVDLVLVLEETGRHAVPEPIVETAAFGVPLLGRADLTVAAGEPWVPWADTADVIFTAGGRYRPRRGRAGRAPVGRRCPPPLRGSRARPNPARRPRKRRARPSIAASAESPPSSAGWPTACSR